jgi:hypothetical protein
MSYANKELNRILASKIDAGSEVCILSGEKSPNRPLDWLISRGVKLISAPSESTDHIVLYNSLEQVPDVYEYIKEVCKLATPACRISAISFSRIWRWRFNDPSKATNIDNWIPPEEIVNLIELAGLELVSSRKFVLLPFYIPIISRFVNRWLAPLPIFRLFTAINLITARTKVSRTEDPSLSIVIAARNESGNIKALIDRIPNLASKQEVIFVEGGSTDSTWEVIQKEVQSQRRAIDFEVSAYKQSGRGKGDAVRKGFSHATGDILMILDADISVEPEELHKFSEALVSGACEFANGTRLVYPLEDDAMRTLNIIGNRVFGLLFTFLLGQHLADTLCGTKVLWRRDYEKIAAGRAYFGEFDPFGDFDLLFGAARLNLRIRDIPIHYKSRTYGSTNISRFRHGLLLFRMTGIAALKLKFI